jgi:hypothetical protein
VLLDTGTEDARMKSVLSSHEDAYDAQGLSLPPFRWNEKQQATDYDDDEDNNDDDDDDDEVLAGGSVLAATLGTIKGMVGYVSGGNTHSLLVFQADLVHRSSGLQFCICHTALLQLDI